jgi:transcriptional regulator of arginine metabolism
VVANTSAGHANPVAVALDREEWPEVAGTVAGDDTILVVAAEAKIAQSVRRKLLRLLEGRS